MPIPKLISMYGRVGRLTASAPSSRPNMNRRYSSQVTSYFPIQNALICTGCGGDSFFAGVPITKLPARIGTISKVILVPGMVRW